MANKKILITLQEFLTEEFLEIREGLIGFIVPSYLNNFILDEFIANVFTKNDDVTFQVNKNGTVIPGTSVTINSSSYVTVSSINNILSTGDIIQIETTNIGVTPSKGLTVTITIKP